MCISVIRTAPGNVVRMKAHGLMCEYLPKGTDLSGNSQESQDEIAERINTRHRKILDFATPKEVYYKMLEQTTSSNGVALVT